MYTRCGLLLMFSACLSAQSPAGVTRNLAVALSGKDTDLTIHIRNEYSSPATAWILQCETPQGGSRHYWNDQELSFESKPIAPGADMEFKFPSMPAMMKQRLTDNGSCEDFHLIAAAFADGTVTGNLAWIDAIVEDRRQAFQDIGKVTGMLNDAISQETDTPAVIQQLKDLGKTSTPAGMPTRASATSGPSWGNRSKGTSPPPMRPSRSPVPSAALWLVENQAMKLPDAVKALGEWSNRLAALSPVAETGEPSPAAKRMLTAGPFTPPSETELLGKPAPNFTLSDVDSHEVKLASLRGKAVLLDFWATWCEPCREATPHIQSLHDRFKDRNLVVLGIDTNEPAEKARKYFADENYTFGNLLGSGNDVVKNYGANGIPLVVLIDKDGIVRYVHRGWGSNLDITPEVKKLIER
jgi:peroxiredoxin